MARETGHRDSEIGGSKNGNNNALLESLVNGYGNEYSDLSAMIENVDAALDALESQSDELFDEVKLMLEEVRKDKAGLDSDTDGAADSGSKSQTDQEDCKQLEGNLSDLCVSEDVMNASAVVTSSQDVAASDAGVEGKDVNESVASSSKMESGKKTTKS